MRLLEQFFRKWQSGRPPFLGLKTDIHSHLIPGIDDGAVNIEESLRMIRKLGEMGFRKLITTPHVMSDAYKNTPEIINRGLELLIEAVSREEIEMEIEAAAEYYLDEVFAGQIAQKPLLSFGGPAKYLLVETSYVTRPMVFEDAMFKLQTMGYTPVLAHPERYQYFWNGDPINEISQIRSRGIKMQVNINSFGGRYSKKAATIAREMATEGLVDFLGTDIHRPVQSDSLAKTYKNSKELRMLIENGNLLNAFL